MKTTTCSLLLTTTGVLALTVLHGFAQDWPQWRGPNRDAHATFTAPATWPKEMSPKWKTAVGDGVATPALVGEKLFVFARQEGAEVLYCLSAATGEKAWAEKYEALAASGPAASFPGPRCSPTVADGKIITLGVRGALCCREAASGKLLWRKDDFQNSLPRFFTSASPLIAEGLCVALVGGPDNGGIIAYDLATGDHKWEWTGNGPSYASPALLTIAGTKHVVAMTDTKVVALTLSAGKLVWEVPFVVQGRGYNASSPIVDGDVVIYTGSSRGTTAVKLEQGNGGLTAKELWKNAEASAMFGSPVLVKGAVYCVGARNDLFCLNAADGKMAWTTSFSAGQPAEAPGGGAGGDRPRGGPGGDRPGGGPGGGGMRGGGMRGGGGGYGSVVDAGSVLLALTPGSQLLVFQPDEKSFTETARIKVGSSPTYAYPVAAGKRIFIKDQDSVMLYTVE